MIKRCHKSVSHAITVETAVVIMRKGDQNLKNALGTAPMLSPKYQYFDAGTSWNVSG